MCNISAISVQGNGTEYLYLVPAGEESEASEFFARLKKERKDLTQKVVGEAHSWQEAKELLPRRAESRP